MLSHRARYLGRPQSAGATRRIVPAAVPDPAAQAAGHAAAKAQMRPQSAGQRPADAAHRLVISKATNGHGSKHRIDPGPRPTAPTSSAAAAAAAGHRGAPSASASSRAVEEAVARGQQQAAAAYAHAHYGAQAPQPHATAADAARQTITAPQQTRTVLAQPPQRPASASAKIRTDFVPPTVRAGGPLRPKSAGATAARPDLSLIHI